VCSGALSVSLVEQFSTPLTVNSFVQHILRRKGLLPPALPERSSGGIGFFFLGLFFLGPFAIAVAILATPGAPRPPLPPLPVQKVKQRPTISDSRPGISVKVVAPGDDHEGRIGTMYEMPDDDDGSQVCVKFSGDSEPYAYGRDEIETIRP
jgi:hypothetical protein